VIREELGLKQLPIVAMTANAMASDRAACLAADMSEHIGKPFDMAKLVSLLLRITDFQASDNTTAYEAQNLTEAPPQPEVPGLDLGTALARMAGMRALYVRTARDFCRILDTIVSELQQCIACGDRKQALMRLHTLKGNAGTLGASALAELAGTLERLCKTDAGMAQCAAGFSGLIDVIADTQAQLELAMLLLAPAALPARNDVPTEVNTALAASTLHQLKALTQAADLDALHCFAQLRSTIAGLPDDFCDRLDEAMQNLDLDSAHALCSEMLVKLAA
jgi:two-component system sensor histidine kinase/response regulator